MIPERYNLSNFKKACRNPKKFKNEFEKLQWALLGNHLCRYTFNRKFGDGIRVVNRDWDNLIIIDACRWDFFKENNWIDGDAEPVISRGSTSGEYLRKNFLEHDLRDTVYVTANPNAEIVEEGVFHTVRKTYTDSPAAGWRPQHVFDLAEETYNEFPNKRLIIHFMQPHSPYLGSLADELRSEVRREFGIQFYHIDKESGEEDLDKNSENVIKDLRSAARGGYISHEDLENAYVENLELVLEYTERLVELLDGKSVITSDHGELLGNPEWFWFNAFGRTKYGHPGNVYVPELRVVPWLEIDSDERRQIVAEDAIKIDHAHQATIDENLEALGYKA